MQPIYYTDQIQRCLDSFFQEKVTAENFCEEELEDQEKQQRRSTVSNTTEGSRKEGVWRKK